jgi:hypothetical protein
MDYPEKQKYFDTGAGIAPLHLIIVLVLLSLLGCGKKEDAASLDTALVAPTHEQYDTAHPISESQANLPMDSLKARQEKDEKQLQRFQPVDVVKIYLDYRPLRNPNTTKTQVGAFLAAHKMTESELHAVLAEGDRLGWK